MNILIAIDSFKGSLTTDELCDAIETGILKVSNDYKIKKTPIADGGEGTYKTLVSGLGGETVRIPVKDPLFKDIEAEYGILKDHTAIIEMATSSGLPLVPMHLQNPLNTSTYGVGQMIKDAISKGCKKFIIGIGGSATNDGGIGMLEALGYRFYDNHHNSLIPIGSSLDKIAYIDDSNKLPELDKCKFLIACDVDNPFYGPNGAAYVYGPQKGASKEDVEVLDNGLKSFNEVIKKTLHKDLSKLSGAGAAGGLGGGFYAFLNAELKPGIDIIFEKLNIDTQMDWADLVITGEGKLDFQTVMGKAPIGIAKIASKKNIPVIALAGSITKDAYKVHDHGITSIFSIINQPMTLEMAMNKELATKMVTNQTSEIFYLIETLKKH